MLRPPMREADPLPVTYVTTASADDSKKVDPTAALKKSLIFRLSVANVLQENTMPMQMKIHGTVKVE